MEPGGRDLEDTADAVGRQPSRDLHEEGHGVAFVEETELPPGFGHRTGVKENPTLDQVPVDVGHHAPDITLGIVLLLLTVFDVVPYP